MKLLSISADAKTVKGEEQGYLTGILYLQPYKTVLNSVTYNVCPMAEKAGCSAPCLNTAGRGNMNSVQAARSRRLELYLKDEKEFVSTLVAEIDDLIKKAKRKNLLPAVRLNGLSDIQWEKKPYADALFSKEATFYDYTKIGTRKPEYPYHLTWSYSTKKVYQETKGAFPSHMNWAVVFDHTKPLPQSFLSRNVIDGDTNDLRFLDPPNSIVGLKAKGRARAESSENHLTVFW